MAFTDINLADRRSGLVESHKGYDPRIIFFYFVIAAMLVVLVAGLAYQQLHRDVFHSKREQQQSQRRIVIPGPRGNIYNRNNRLLVTNSPRWTVVLHLGDLKREFLLEETRILKNYQSYQKTDPKDIPNRAQRREMAHVSVAQRYLDKVNQVLRQQMQVDAEALKRHFRSELLIPFTLVDGLEDQDFARLIEHLPVNSPLEVYATNVRSYPFGSAAAHVLGYVRQDAEDDKPEATSDDDNEAAATRAFKIKTFRLKSTTGRDGLEKRFDAQLQGESGGKIYLVDPSGFKVAKPLEEIKPTQGKSLVTSLDIDLQLAAENALAPGTDPKEWLTGAAVAMDVATGEVLAFANKPDYDLNAWYPRLSAEAYKKIEEQGAFFNQALNAVYPPGSTFKILVSIAGLRSGMLVPNDTHVDCRGAMMIGRYRKTCDNGEAQHGHLDLVGAIAKSCDIYYYQHGIDIGPDLIAAEARRFHLDRPTGLELPNETKRMNIPDRDWLRAKRNEAWTDGHTANMAIGQGAVDVTPMDMACFIASVARDEVYTQPTLLHDPNRPPQHSEPIGLTPAQREVLLAGMQGVITMPGGTAYKTLNLPSERIPGVRVAGKTGTAEYGKDLNIAWFVCFAPVEKPEIAVVVAVRSDVAGETFGGGTYAAPVANAILKKYFEKKANPTGAIVAPVRSRKK